MRSEPVSDSGMSNGLSRKTTNEFGPIQVARRVHFPLTPLRPYEQASHDNDRTEVSAIA
jgi:hypothetical protein